MSAAVAALAGAGAAVGLWLALADVLRAPALRRLNVHGRVVPVGGGLVLVLAVLVVAGGDAVADALRGTVTAPLVPGALVVAVLGFGLLGLLDDLLESGDTKGFGGHLAALARGRLTTGAVKLVGGGLVALVVAPARFEGRLLWFLLDGALVALCANLGNLLDRAPGRVGKVALLLGVPLVALHDASMATGLAVVLGAAAALLVPDLRERVMLGDAGANVLGATLGLTFVVVAGGPARVAALVVVAGLNVASERVSFSTVIARTPILRTVDRWGRAPR